MKKNVNDPSVRRFFEGLLTLESVEECYAFFDDICTRNEILSIAQRFQVGEMLLDKNTYQTISKTTGASTTTISRVNRLLGDDQEGIEMVHDRLRGK